MGKDFKKVMISTTTEEGPTFLLALGPQSATATTAKYATSL